MRTKLIVSQRSESFPMNKSILLLGPLVAGAIALGAGAANAAVIDNVNGSFLPPFLVFGGAIDNIGWDYTPSFSYNLTGISTYFEPVGNPAPVTRTVTVVLESTAGGAPIATGAVSVGPSGGAVGVTFSPITLTADQTYFVGFENVLGLGLNIVDWFQGVNGPPNQQPVGTVNLDGWYNGTPPGNNFQNFIPQMVGDQLQVFSAPILNFSGTPVGTPTPEPSTWAMMLAGFASLGFLAYRRTVKAHAAA
jgi:hypothetical protein